MADDPLDTSRLHAPMLNDFLKSQQLKAEMEAIGKFILRRYQDKVPVHTGNLRSTAHINTRRVVSGRPRTARWCVDFTAGGERAPYAWVVEGNEHTLTDILNEMGWPDVNVFIG